MRHKYIVQRKIKANNFHALGNHIMNINAIKDAWQDTWWGMDDDNGELTGGSFQPVLEDLRRARETYPQETWRMIKI